MTASLEELAGKLELLLDCADKLGETLQRKQRVLVRHKLDDLEELAAQEQALSLRMARLERSRQELAQRLAQELGLQADEGTDHPLSTVLKHVQPLLDDRQRMLAERVAELAERLSASCAKVLQVNLDNAQLSNNLLAYSQMLFSALTSGDKPSGYRANGSAGLPSHVELLNLQA